MPTQRTVVDYSLQRRALLQEVFRGKVGLYEVCDASPYLLRAAQYFGESTTDRCPICRREALRRVHYVYGDRLKSSAGQARRRAELARMAPSVGDFDVYVVEVCPSCFWNHLVEKLTVAHEAEAAADLPREPDFLHVQ